MEKAFLLLLSGLSATIKYAIHVENGEGFGRVGCGQSYEPVLLESPLSTNFRYKNGLFLWCTFQGNCCFLLLFWQHIRFSGGLVERKLST